MEGQATQSARATICVIDPMGGTDPGLAQVLQPYCVIDCFERIELN